jgi:hypothetical protein
MGACRAAFPLAAGRPARACCFEDRGDLVGAGDPVRLIDPAPRGSAQRLPGVGARAGADQGRVARAGSIAPINPAGETINRPVLTDRSRRFDPLSRQRSRVRVPSLPLQVVPANGGWSGRCRCALISVSSRKVLGRGESLGGSVRGGREIFCCRWLGSDVMMRLSFELQIFGNLATGCDATAAGSGSLQKRLPSHIRIAPVEDR